MGPVRLQERIGVLDALRGAALFGIIAANMRGFNGPLAGYMDHTLMWTGPADRIAQGFVDLLISGKFITLFAFMFGIGFAIQMERAEAKGLRHRHFYLRRLSVLLAFGILHAVLLWWGDILGPYALMGFGLFLFRRSSQRKVLWWASGLYMYPLVMMAGMVTLQSLGVKIPGPPPTTLEELQRILNVYGSGTYAEIVRQNIKELPFNLIGLVFFYPRVLGIFLFGLWVWRAGIIRNLRERTGELRGIQVHGLWIGLVLNVGFVAVGEVYHPNPAQPSVEGLVQMGLMSFGVPALSLCYASTLALLWQSPAWRGRMEGVAAVGRTALSNYLFQTVACTTLYYSWGFGLYGKVGPLMGLVPTIVVYMLQLRLSLWWTRRFEFGPMEWVWRRLTYGRVPQLQEAAS